LRDGIPNKKQLLALSKFWPPKDFGLATPLPHIARRPPWEHWSQASDRQAYI